MNETKNGGPAFPVPDIDGGAVQEGMTLRDYFAAKAMQGIITDRWNRYSDYGDWAELAYKIADEMLKAREK